MDNKEYTDLVTSGTFPIDNIVPLNQPFKDERGEILNLLLTPVNGIAIITSKAGSVRSNHYHKTDWHYLYVLEGSMNYYERDTGMPGDSAPILVQAGQMIFTGPMKIHKTEFLQDTVLLSFSKIARSHDNHEEDLVRMEY